MKLKLAIAAMVAAFSMVAVAGDEEFEWSKLDADQDGKISAEESKAHAALSEQFTEVDVNADGEIDEVEFAQFEEANK
jgi:Ca2+-binding EF-hand superfamily protein